MSGRDAVKFGVSVVLLAGAAVLLMAWLRGPVEGVGGDVSCWLCTDSACGKEFTKPVVEIARLRQQGNSDANPPCPYCKKATTIRCVPCPNCGKFLRPAAHGQLPKTCPKCEKPTVGAAQTMPAAPTAPSSTPIAPSPAPSTPPTPPGP